VGSGGGYRGSVRRVKVIGVDHVVFNASDIERSLAWYAEVLGLEGERVDEWRRGDLLFPSIRINATTIVDLFPAERTGENVNHVCLVCEDTSIDDLVARFPDGRRADGLFGAQGYASSVYVNDPDGNTIELRCYS
jgi:catechol 2,3-dioxygenase-like lactoylglutathione lyase family enzyme